MAASLAWGTAGPTARAQHAAGGSTPTITTTALPALHVLETYHATLAAEGGAPPYTWSAADLPGGLALDPASGRLTNDLAAPAITTVPEGPLTITVTDSQGTSATAELPLEIVTVERVALGQNHTCAVTSAGALYCWGYNLSGQLGDGTTEDRALPTPVRDPHHPDDPGRAFSGVVDVAAGEAHTCALTADDAIYCWGYNGAGRLGLGHETPETIPVPSRVVGQAGGFFTGAVALTAGNLHTCALTDAEEAFCWGDNFRGQVGRPGQVGGTPAPVADPSDPTQPLGGMASISAGSFHTCAVTTGGTAYCWGWNNAGQLGIGSLVPAQSSLPLLLPNPADPAQPLAGLDHVSAGAFHACAATEAGTAYCWGQNAFGQLGHGDAPNNSPSPVLVADPDAPGQPLGGLQAVRLGNMHSCALTEGGGAFCWGVNEEGQLGNGGHDASDVPVAVADPDEPAAPIAGLAALGQRGWQTCAVTEDGLPLCWGSNTYGQLGDGTTEARNLPTPVHPRITEAPALDVTPSSITMTLAQGQVDVAMLTLSNPGGTTLAWAIAQGEAGCTLPPWVSVAPQSGEIAPGGLYQLGVVLLGAILDPGAYEANLCLASNDPAQPLTVVPIALTVTGGGAEPALAFEPAEGLEATVEAGQMTTGSVTLTNTGGSPLNFSFGAYDSERTYANPANPLADVMHRFPRQADRSRDFDVPRHVPARGSGGPDPFGYTWTDSNEPGGPVFEPIDISASGQVLAVEVAPGCSLEAGDEGIAQVSLPFSFLFYGEAHTRLWVSTNGFIALQPVEGCHFLASAFPSPTSPNEATPGAMIAPLWLDMGVTLGGDVNVFTELLPDGRFVVQWNAFERLGEDVPNTFQAILSPGGTITYQYLDVNVQAPLFGGPQIGIQNHDGTAGLTIASGLGYAEAGLAVRISAPPAFVAGVEPASGTLAPGASVELTVTFDATGLLAGTYTGALIVETDEPAAYEYPVTLTVTGHGHLNASPDPLAFGEVIVGVSETQMLTITNTGTATTTITGIETDSDAYTVAFSGPVTLVPGTSTTVEVTFAPSAEGATSATLTVAASSGDATVGLTGSGLRPPEAEVSAESLALEITAGQTASATLTLANAAAAGAADLTFEAAVAAAQTRTVRLVTPSRSRAPEAATVRSDGAALTDGRAGGQPFVEITGAPFASRRATDLTLTHSASTEIDAEAGVGCANWEAGYNRANQYYRVFDLSAFGIETEFRVERVEVGVWMGHVENLPTTTVRLHTLEGPLSTGNLTPVAEAEVTLTPALHLGLAEAIFAEAPVFSANDVLVVEWAIPDGASAGHLVIAGFNGAGQTGPTYIRSSDCGAEEPTDLAALGFPDFHWVMQVHGQAGPALLAVSPESGEIAPGASQELTLTVDATETEPGEYAFEVFVTTNDPARPTVTVPVTVIVTTEVATEDGALPTAFALDQNYPNPFAARTVIEYALPEATHVTLAVYDAVGRLVATLVDAEQQAGFHGVAWEARGLASGVYFYRIEAGSFRSTHKMVLVQ